MFKRIVSLSLLALLLLPTISFANLVITVEHNAGWGNAPTSNIKALCDNIALHFQEQFRDEHKVNGRLTIVYDPNGPINYYRESFGGAPDEYRIGLAVTDTYWSQFSYQFGHEFCHVIQAADDKPRNDPNVWFYEAICELANLWVIRRMSETWAYRAPYQNWVDYRHALADYANNWQISRAEVQYDGTGADWLQEWEQRMRRDASGAFTYARVSQLSYKFLPIFEENPEAWNAVRQMPNSTSVMSEYMQEWYRNVDIEDKKFVEAIAEEMGILINSTVAVNTNTDVNDLNNVNVLMYTGTSSWMSIDDVNLQSQTTKQVLASKGIQAEIVQTGDSVRDWMLQTTSDGNVDVLILYGTLPISIYPPFNSQQDGSVAENWIESTDGNTILNHGNYFGFLASGNQKIRGENHIQALQAIMDIPHITMWDFGLENNTPMVVTKDGKEITPSLTNFKSDRAFHLDELTGDWFAEKVLASNIGTSQATRADPVVVRDGNRGRIGIVYQTFNEVNPKGKVVAELITNFLLENNSEISSPPLEPMTDNDTADRSDTVSLLPISVPSPNIGQHLKLSLKITNGENVAGYQATVQFDDTALRYVESTNSDYLPDGAFFVPPISEGNLIKLNAASVAGESNGDGTLATLTFEVIAVKASTLTLSDVLLSNSAGETFAPQVENAQITEPTKLTGDINGDGTVNIADLVLVASNLGQIGANVADVNSDGVVNIADLVLVAGALGTSAAPSIHPQALEMFTATEVKQWLSAAQRLNPTDMNSQRGILFLQQLLVALTPKETALLPNFPNPFNPETWIPYHLAKGADVLLHIYAMNGALVRTLTLGHQAAGKYENRSRAAYWDGKNAFGEPVASGPYFYTLTAGDFTATRKMLIRK